MPFGPITIQPPAKLNYRNTYSVEDTAASDIRNGDIAAINQDHRREWREWQEEHQ